MHPLRYSVIFLLLVISTGIMIGDVPKLTKGTTSIGSASPGDLIWFSSENSALQARGVAVDATGVYVVGYAMSTLQTTFEWRIEKRDLATGETLLNITENISPYGGKASAVAVDSTGFYVVGSGPVGWKVEKRDLASGALTWVQSEDIGGAETANGVAVGSSGLYVVGYDSNNAGGFKEWRVEKRDLTTGTLIWGISEQIGVGAALPTDIAYGVAVDSTGLYVVGSDTTVSGALEWRIEKRNLTSGTILWSTSESLEYQSEAEAVAVNSMGVYVVGYEANPPTQLAMWRMEARSPSTGATLWAQTEQFSGSSIAYGVAVDSTGVYVVGSDGQDSRVEKRSMATGAIMWGQSESLAPNAGVALAAAVDSTGVYVPGFTTNTMGIFAWRIEKRNLGSSQTLTTITTSSTQTLTQTTTLLTTSSSTTSTTNTALSATVSTTTQKPVITATVSTTVTTTGSPTRTFTATSTQILTTSTATSQTTILTFTTTLQTVIQTAPTTATVTSSTTSFSTTTDSGLVTITQTDIFNTIINNTIQLLSQLVSTIIKILHVNSTIVVKTPKGRIVHRVTVVK